MRELLRERGRWIAAAAVAGLTVYAYLTRVRFLLGWPYPFGIDGYWYPVQVRAILETGHLQYPSAPLVPWVMALVARVTDPFSAAKMVAAAGTALMVVPAYLLGRRLSEDRAAAVFGATLVATSAESFYLSTEFVKEGIGLTLAASFLAALFAALETSTKRRWGLAIVLFVAALLAHKTAAGLAVVLGLPAVLVRRRSKLVLGIAGGAAAALLLLGALAPRAFAGLRDLRLLGHLFRLHPDFTLPVLAPAGFTPLRFQHEVAIAALLALFLIALRLSRRDRAPLPPESWGFLGYALLLAIPWLDVADVQGLAYRLRLSAFVVLAPLAALAARRAAATLAAQTRTFLFAGAALGLLLGRPSAREEGIVRAHPALVLSVRLLAGVVPPGTVVVTPDRQVAFMAVWYARVAVQLKATEPMPDGSYRLIPGSFVSKELAKGLDAYAGPDPPLNLHQRPRGMMLIPERTWQALPK